jgi:hypothetical protein
MDFLDLTRDFLEDLFREGGFAKPARTKETKGSRKVKKQNKIKQTSPAPFGTLSTEMTFDHRSIDWRLLCLLFIFEAVLFFAVYNREIAWYPPANFDQASYLMSTYRLQEDVLEHGFGKFWKAIRSAPNATGVALPIEGALFGIIMGGARLPQLCVNFVLFFALQAVAFYTARALWSNRFYGYALVGLILCQATPWLGGGGGGGLFDFRIDFAAYSLYGIWACTVLRSKLFLDFRWAIGAGLVGGFLVLHRFLTIVYLLGVYAGFATVCAIIIGLLARGDTALIDRLRQRLKNLGFSFAALTFLAGPVLLLNSKSFWNYYFIGHVVSDEKYIRAKEAGIHDLIGHLLFYPRSIFNDHLGQTFFLASLIAITGSIAASLLDKTRKNGFAARHNEEFLLQIIFLLGAIVGPVLVLTADISKSSIVGGIVGVPTAILIVVFADAIRPKATEFASRKSPKLLAGSAMLIFALGIFNQVSRGGRHWPEFSDQVHLRQMAELNHWLANYAREYHWKNPAISLDIISSYLNCGTITATGFERTGHFIEFYSLLGSSILAQPLDEALRLLEKSDFVILTSPHQGENYPFADAIAAYWTELKTWADKHLLTIKTQRVDAVFPYNVLVYARPCAQLRDVSGDWITSAGVLIEAKRSDLQRFPVIRLKGAADFRALPKVPAVTANLEPSDDSPPIAAIFRRIGNQYEVEVNTSAIQLPADETVRIRVKFDTFYVRKDAALHNDFRELVVRSPDVRLLPLEQ